MFARCMIKIYSGRSAPDQICISYIRPSGYWSGSKRGWQKPAQPCVSPEQHYPLVAMNMYYITSLQINRPYLPSFQEFPLRSCPHQFYDLLWYCIYSYEQLFSILHALCLIFRKANNLHNSIYFLLSAIAQSIFCCFMVVLHSTLLGFIVSVLSHRRNHAAPVGRQEDKGLLSCLPPPACAEHAPHGQREVCL